MNIKYILKLKQKNCSKRLLIFLFTESVNVNTDERLAKSTYKFLQFLSLINLDGKAGTTRTPMFSFRITDNSKSTADEFNVEIHRRPFQVLQTS